MNIIIYFRYSLNFSRKVLFKDLFCRSFFFFFFCFSVLDTLFFCLGGGLLVFKRTLTFLAKKLWTVFVFITDPKVTTSVHQSSFTFFSFFLCRYLLRFLCRLDNDNNKRLTGGRTIVLFWGRTILGNGKKSILT